METFWKKTCAFYLSSLYFNIKVQKPSHPNEQSWIVVCDEELSQLESYIKL